MSASFKPRRLPVTSLSAFLIPTAPLDVEGARLRFLQQLNPTRVPCLRCGAFEGVQLEASRTAYALSCSYEPDPEGMTREPCLASLGASEGYACKKGHAKREDCPMWPKAKDDPNAPLPLCRECAKFHHEFWDEQWAEYYGGRI